MPRVRILPVLEYHICTDGGYFEEIDTSGVGVIIFAPLQWQRLQGELSRARSEAIEHDFLPHGLTIQFAFCTSMQILKDPSDFEQVLLPIITERLIGKNSSHRIGIYIFLVFYLVAGPTRPLLRRDQSQGPRAFRLTVNERS